MGKYLNPGNEGFARIRQGTYVDKTGLIGEINRRIGTAENLVCVSRPRRFGKSYAAQVLSSYYDCTCDSHRLFDDCEIAKTAGYEAHINAYHVLYLDIAGFLSDLSRQNLPLSGVTARILDAVRAEVVRACPKLDAIGDASDCLLAYVREENRKVVFILDEWDAVIREARQEEATQKAYLNLLRSWFKNGNFTPYVVAAAYMTGILPIKKDGSESAISDFQEVSMLYPGVFAEYAGFTESEVRKLSLQSGVAFSDLAAWYDGYDFPECEPIYNPYSVMQAVRSGMCRSYWGQTSAAESLLTYINMDFDGLREIVARLIAGEEMGVDVQAFQNDLETFRSKDDVLTLLVHLGYLCYSEEEGTVRIPNEEVRMEFRRILTAADASEKWIRLIQKSRKLLKDTLAGEEEAVAEAIEQIRDTEYAPTFYNDEQALRYVVKFAYIAAIGQYMKVEELPSGHGIADVAYIPKARSPLPALLVELKWNRSAGGAIAQIRERNYPAVFKNAGGEAVLVGINYSEKTRRHTCRIERIQL